MLVRRPHSSSQALYKNRATHWRDKLSLHEIAEHTGLSRNTLRQMPGRLKMYKCPSTAGPQALGKPHAFTGELEQALQAAGHRRKNRRTAKALFAQIQVADCAGRYCTVTDFTLAWRGSAGKPPHAIVPLSFGLGERRGCACSRRQHQPYEPGRNAKLLGRTPSFPALRTQAAGLDAQQSGPSIHPAAKFFLLGPGQYWLHGTQKIPPLIAKFSDPKENAGCPALVFGLTGLGMRNC